MFDALIPARTRTLAVASLCCAVCITNGCRQVTQTEEQMRAAIAQAVGSVPPASCQLLGFRTAGKEGKSALWVLHAEEPLQIAQHIKPSVRSTIPIAILRTIVQDVAEADVNMSAPVDARCDYVEWTHDNMNVRLRQAHTATGWYASLETSVESDN